MTILLCFQCKFCFYGKHILLFFLLSFLFKTQRIIRLMKNKYEKCYYSSSSILINIRLTMVIPCDMLFMGNQRVFLYDLLFFFFPDFFPGFSYFQFFSLNSPRNRTVQQPFNRRWWWDWLFQILWRISFRSVLTGILIPIFPINYNEWYRPELSQQQG